MGSRHDDNELPELPTQGDAIRTATLIRFVGRVCVAEPLDTDIFAYLEMPMTGRLDWYFDHVSTAMAHSDSSEIHDEMKAVLDRQSHLRESEIKAFDMKNWPVRL